jgi:hypothetical protein
MLRQFRLYTSPIEQLCSRFYIEKLCVCQVVLENCTRTLDKVQMQAEDPIVSLPRDLSSVERLLRVRRLAGQGRECRDLQYVQWRWQSLEHRQKLLIRPQRTGGHPRWRT